MHDLVNNLERKEEFIGAYTTTQNNSEGVDLQGLRNPTAYVYVGAMSAGSPQGTWAFKLQHADTNADGSFEDVAASDVVLGPENDSALADGVFATVGETGSWPVAPTDDDTIYGVSYVGSKRYARIVATPSDSPGSTVIAAFWLAEPSVKPATT